MNDKLLMLLESVLGKSKSTAKQNYAFHCPYCHSARKKFEVSIINQSSHCWSCNRAHKKLTTLFKAINVSRDKLSELYKLLNTQPNYSGNKNDKFQRATTVIDLPKEFIPLYKHSNTTEYKNAIHYLRNKRKITLSEIVKYNIGYCESGEYAKKIIIPSYDESGKLNYFVGRAYYEAESFKHKNPDVPKNCVGHELFINWGLPLVLVEGSFDAIAVRRNAIPLFGKTISNTLKKRIVEKRVKTIYICLDRDARKQALDTAEYFISNGIEVFFVDLTGKDPSELGFKNIQELLNITIPMTSERLMEEKILCAL